MWPKTAGDSKYSAIWRYGMAAVAVAAALGLRLAFDPVLGRRSPFLVFPIAILLAARFGGWLPGLASTLLSALGGWYFLINPPFSFAIKDKADAEDLAIYIISATGISLLGGQLRVSLISKTKSEQAAKQSESTLRAVLEALPAGVALIDAQGRKVESNAAFEQVWAGPRAATRLEDYAARKAWWVDTGKPVQQDEWASARAVQKGETVLNQEMQIERLDGSRAFVLNSAAPIRDAQGRISGSAVAIRDITELKHAEEALRESESRFRALVTATSDVVYRMSPDWKMMFYLRGRDFIPDTEEPSGTWLQKYIHSDDQAYVMAAINEAIRTKSTFALEHRVRRVDGSLGWTFSRAIPIQNADGEIVEWFGAARDITERIRAELELQESRQELRALADRLINAEEEERKRISRELHDNLSQKLAMLAFDTGSLVQMPVSSMEEIRERLRNLQTQVVQMSQDVRQIAHQLHPSILEDLGLNSALSELCGEFSTRTGIVATCEQETPPEAMPMEVASCLYRVAQEALHNVSKHAQATRVRLTIRGSPEGVRLGIHDDGAGFDLYAGRRRHGIGIVSMKERVRLVQGEFSIHSEPGLGTTVSIFVPLAKEVL